ncbi:M48 family peptidase [Myxococcus stipitatus DSM 14675]|uniref:M48 family peptidase n=1 Tax=Myxococcus stipitatus (strain DSM 14675 / JCM 12634 / Mx s8) TaxID=1278073 RepID=L7UJF9_MYXSD|nr:M48 family metallopeptidase [Myxococcus stipitatus]AGC48143.1 M48 family peptidase [Myxococcus stipitatus DSM 14675]
MSSSGVGRRAVLMVVLWVGFWLMGLAVVAALLWLPFTEMFVTGGLGLSGIIAGAGAVTVLWALRPRGWFTRREQSDVAPLTREEFPALFALLDEVAQRAKAKVPQKVYLSGEATAYITVERKWFGLRRTPVVGIGLPLFAFLERAELASVLAYECGHHQGGDLALEPWVYRTRRSIALAVDALEDSAFFLDVPFQLYGRFFLRISSAVSQSQELKADALAASVCGVQAASAALRKIYALAPYWQAYLEQDLVPLFQAQAGVPMLEGFRRFLSEPRRRVEMEQRIEEELKRPSSPWDTHPSLEERLRSMGSAGNASATIPELLPLSGCVELLGGEREAESAWVKRSIRGTLVSFHWEEVAEKVIAPGMQKDWAGSDLDPKHTPLTALPGLLKEGEALWNRVRPPGIDVLSPEGKRQQVRRMLVGWLGTALVHRGFMPEVRPGANLRLMLGDISVEPASILRRLSSGELSEAEYLSACEVLEEEAAAQRAAG